LDKSKGCSNLGLMHDKGKGVKQDDFKAVTPNQQLVETINILLGNNTSRINY
jgi:TPR repeat protein